MINYLLAFFLLSSNVCLAQSSADTLSPPPAVAPEPSYQINPYAEPGASIFSNKMKRSGIRRGSAVWFPLLSFVVPGMGQFLNGQSAAGFLYSSTAVVGLGTAFSAMAELDKRYVAGEIDLGDIDSRDPYIRRYLWGMKTYELAGSLSLYHSFQTTLQFRKQQGDFQFLPEEGETTDELLLAPFQFSNLGRWSTLIPLTVGIGLVVSFGANDNYHTRGLDSDDVLFSTGISYNAGVGEEALFRGWMFPLFTELYGVENIFWANLTQATIFGAAHYSRDNPLPLAQAAFGYYFGWLAQKNGWSLKEAIFVHTWWDVIVFTASAAQGDKKASIYVPLYQTQF